MSTRGIYGFRKNGQDKLSYNHCDSYPEWLGKQITDTIQSFSIEQLNEFYDHIVMVDQGDDPGDVIRRMIARIKPFYSNDRHDWYWILREFQGRLDLLYELYKRSGIAYMTDDSEFITDSLFCEYAYIINLDTQTLEFWRGFQLEPQPGNRYGEEPRKEEDPDNLSYPCALIREWPLEYVRKNPDGCVQEMIECALDADD